MTDVEILTNHRPRLLLDWNQLTEAEQAEFDWMTEPADEDFFRYKKRVYALSEFTLAENTQFKGWDGYLSDSFFSGVLIKLTPDPDRVVVGTFMS